MNKTWHRKSILLASGSVCILVILMVARWQGLAYARRELESQLGQIQGVASRVEGVEFGWTQVIAHDVRLLDKSTGEPWLRIERLVTDLTFWELISGKTKLHQIVVERGDLILRFDLEGKLLTQLPPLTSGRPLPIESIVVRNASITLERARAEPLLAARIDGRLQANGAGIEASATIGDLFGSVWKLEATSGGRTQMTLSTLKLQLTGTELTRLPSVPPAVADIEQLSAAVTIGLELTQGKDGTQNSRIQVTVASLQADAPRAGVRLDDGSARFVIENRILQLDSLQGDFAGGSVSLVGVMNLAKRAGSLKGTVEEIVLTELPAGWKVPPTLTGRLTGETTLQLELSDGDFLLEGTARGTVNNAEVAGLAIEPIELEMQLDPRPLGAALSGNVQVDLGFSTLDVRELLTKFDSTANGFAEKTRGVLNGALRLTVPLQGLEDLSRYRGTGRLSSAEISAGELIVRDAETQILIDGGALLLDQVNCQVAGGSVGGQIMAAFESGAVHADLTLEALSISEFAKLTRVFTGDMKGDVAGEITLDGSWRKLATLEAWTATGQLKSGHISFHDDTVTDTAATFRLDQGLLQFNKLRAAWTGSEIAGSAVVDLRSPHAFTADLSASQLALAHLTQRFPASADLQQVQGTAAITAKFNGTLQPLAWQVEGGITLGRVSFAPWIIDRGDARWRLEDETVRVTQFHVAAYRGMTEGTARIALDARSFEAVGTFANIVSDSLPHLPDPNFKVSGPASGNFSVTRSEASKQFAAQVELSGLTLSAHGITVSELAGTASFGGIGLTLQVKGQALEGVVSLEGVGRVPADREDMQLAGQLRAEGIQLSTLASMTGDRLLQQLEGNANADIAFTITGPELKPTGRGNMSIERLRWKGTAVASSATAQITLAKDALVLQGITAQLSEGTARGEMILPLTASRRGTFRMNLERVRSRQLLAFWPSLTGVADGELDLRLAGRMDRSWHGSGQLRMSRAEIAGISIQRVQVPMHWSFASDSNRIQIDANDASLHVGGGRVATNLKLTLGRRLDIKCSGKVQSVDLRALLKQAVGTSRGIDGALTADFSFEGRNVRSANDLMGTYDARLVRSRAMLLPVLQDLATALGVGSVSGRFDDSEAHGRLSKGGLLTVEEMHLANSDVQMGIDGRVWLNGRLDLAVTAHTGQFGASTLLGQLLRSPLRFVQPVGIGLLIQANDFFERRLLFFNIDGTIRNPIVRPRAAEFLSQEVVLFFLDQASSQLLQ